MVNKLSLFSGRDEKGVRLIGALAIPAHTMKALDEYFIKGWSPGSFLTSILTNNLYGAVNSADHANKHVIYEIVKWLVTEAEVPTSSWGSEENIKDWLHDTNNIRTKWVDKIEKKYIWETLKA
jgi:hypothetical protein